MGIVKDNVQTLPGCCHRPLPFSAKESPVVPPPASLCGERINRPLSQIRAPILTLQSECQAL